MPPRVRLRNETLSPIALLLALSVLGGCLGGCSSIGDLGTLQPDLVTDDIHAWVGRDAALNAGLPASHNNLTDDERTLRDLAFPLIEPPYDRQRWDAVIYEYGIDRRLHRGPWIDDPAAYYLHLQGDFHRSTAARYNQLMDDIRNDIVRIEPFVEIAIRVIDLDRRREAAMAHVADLSPAERSNAQARVDENLLVVAWVQHSLVERCAEYRFALEHLAAAEPESEAGDVDVVLTQLQQAIAADGLPQTPQLAGLPVVATGGAVLSR
jgi:hypothetical protein